MFYASLNTSQLLPPLPYASLADARTQHWPLVDSFANVAVLVALYLLMVHFLPQWMQRRKALQIRSVLVVYNALMAALNAHICRQLLTASLRLDYNYWCQPCRVVYSQDELVIASTIWWFYISKLLEFADTLFFILRKNSHQLSFLHVYHHSTMFPLWWIAIKWVPTGSTFFPALINSFIHVIMYSYYGLSAFAGFSGGGVREQGGGSMHRLLLWKRYLTALQLLQFTIGLVWALQAIASGCDFPMWINWATVAYMISFLILFGRFYVRQYRTRNKSK